MSIAKAIFSGTVFRAPEKRFTRKNVPVTFFTLQLDDNPDLLLRVISKGKTAESVESSISKSDRVVVEGRLETDVIQDENGEDKRIMQIEVNSIEVLSGSLQGSSKQAPKGEVKFAEDDFSDDLIDNEEIPF